MAPAADPLWRLALETPLLTLAHQERNESVRQVYAPALRQHSPFFQLQVDVLQAPPTDA
jgi:hypothetical protein